MISSLFVYGTLMAPSVVETLIGRLPRHSAAFLAGYRRHPVRTQRYPGIVPAADTSSVVEGVLYQELTASELQRLDWFEDDEYTRTDVRVQGSSSGTKFEATQVYVWTNPLEELDVSRDWDWDHFCAEHLEDYLRDVVRPCRLELDRRLL